MKKQLTIAAALLLTQGAFQLPATAQIPSTQARQPQRSKTPAQVKTCPLDRATYSAIGKPAFELQFSPIENPKIAVESVAFTLQHPDRGMLATYHLGGSMGYGSYYLRDLAKAVEDDTDNHLKPVFFDANLQQADPHKGNAPKYLFVSGLGKDDWYSDRADNRSKPLHEVMWQLSACRP